ncbi:hypothetical protein [Oribacterium sp. WCC10]|uniref:hypothetical protein n=1 Tax=Oribacterium sp. WCC10 TaxID=1855343 RepID=UPI0008E7FC91|nr:hypothetical protein [Oribacterium sp. WCC10]SFG34215.1 hypothetical protein SAMN05216356_10652 [Oribacterium sp. WCC10]
MPLNKWNSKNDIQKLGHLAVWAAPFVGTAFLFWYIKSATRDIVYSDYIRLINSYIPDTLSKDSFLVSDILTRIPVTYPIRWLNVKLFAYSVDFDRMLGLLGVFLMMLMMSLYLKRESVGVPAFLAIIITGFSLNKWELLINGSGYPHFLSYGLFFYNYLVFERVFTGTKRTYDVLKLFLIPYTALLLAGPYIVQFCAALIAAALYTVFIKNRNVDRKQMLFYAITTVIPILLFLWSNSTAVYEHNISEQRSVIDVVTKEAGFTLHFMLNGFASELLDGSGWETMLSSGAIGYKVIYAVGALMVLLYVYAIFLYFQKGIYLRTVFPLLLVVSGLLSHLLVFLSRYLYLVETYAWQSRYSLQYLPGVLGILIIYGKVSKEYIDKHYRRKKGEKRTTTYREDGSKLVLMNILPAVTAFTIFIACMTGSLATDLREINNAPFRKIYFESMENAALNTDNYTDDELNHIFEYNHGAGKVREAFSILRDNRLNIFSERH